MTEKMERIEGINVAVEEASNILERDFIFLEVIR
jgi:hypothetical protein